MSLDDDIAAWAATVRLPDADADAIFKRIVRTPARSAPAAPAAPGGPGARAARGLAPSWWRDFNAGFAARMVASTRGGRPGHQGHQGRQARPALRAA